MYYIHTSSNHSSKVIKHLPVSIEIRFSNNSSNEQVFSRAKPEYEKGLEDSGYENNMNLKYRARKEKEKE